MLFADERSIVVRGVRGHSSFPPTSRLHETSKEFWVNAALNEDSAGTQTDLSLRKRKRCN